MPARVTLVDVARTAGVSRATASRVLSGTSRNVDPDLVRRVTDSAEALGYRPDPVARALRTRSSGTIGVLVPSLRNPYFVHLVEALTRASTARGSTLVLAESDGDWEVEAERLATLSASMVDGLVVVPASTDRSGPALAHAATMHRVVQVDRWTRDAGCGGVAVDNAAAVRLLVEHLRVLGRERIVFVGAEQESSSGAERLAAFRELGGPDADVLVLPRFSTQSGHEAGAQILAREVRPDAVLCSADVLAVGLVTTLQRAGVVVPDEVAVTGFDNTDLLRLVNPPLTTTDHHIEDIAQRALEILAGDGAPATSEGPERFTPTLVVRPSTLR